MNIQSALKKDTRKKKTAPGAYEWWYFDAVSNDGDVEFVIIFYEGNPFSRRYIRSQQKGLNPRAEDFPAISISVYQNNHPVYYSFTEVDKWDALFSNGSLQIQIGEHTLAADHDGNELIYKLMLKETLASGDFIEGNLTFKGPAQKQNLFQDSKPVDSSHFWQVIQPQAAVLGLIRCSALGSGQITIDFEGMGYHDHNSGSEPLKKEFDHWYWGRFHFDDWTLIYYIMDIRKQDRLAWLISGDGRALLQCFDTVRMEDKRRTIYGLNTAKKLIFSNGTDEVLVQQRALLDNGPFYQRFSSDAFLNISTQNIMQTSRGITEYLCPPRIYNRLYWPLTNMRIRYKKESPHWVQRSKTLYRWTW